MRAILCTIILASTLCSCSLREHYLHRARESMTVAKQSYYIKLAKQIPVSTEFENPSSPCRAYTVGLGSFTYSCGTATSLPEDAAALYPLR